jgi:hypothetical protein
VRGRRFSGAWLCPYPQMATVLTSNTTCSRILLDSEGYPGYLNTLSCCSSIVVPGQWLKALDGTLRAHYRA